MLVRGLFARAAGRASVSDPDWCPLGDGGYGRDIPEGTLWLRPRDEGWVVVWCGSSEDARPIAIGSRNEVEQDTRDFVFFGLPGGAEPSGRPPWRFEEGSLHHGAGDGSFRLMLQHGGRGGLVFVRHDAAVFFLGEDSTEALTRSADARRGHSGVPLHAWFAGRRLPLRGVGVVGVVGQAELARDVHVVLVQVDHDRYEMHIATTSDACGLLGVYTSADLLRGDLGAILLAGPVHRSASPTPPPLAVEPAAQPIVEPARPPPPEHREPSPVVDKATRPAPSFTAEDRQRLETCLTPRRRVHTGAGASAMPHIYDGFRMLMDDALECLADAVRLYGSPLSARTIRDLINEKRDTPIPGCLRTFTRALVRFLAETSLGERVRRRYQLHLPDWQRVITMLRANYAPAVPKSGHASATPSSRRDSPRAATPSSTPFPSRVEASASTIPTSSPPAATITNAGEPRAGDLAGPPTGNLYQPGPVEPVVSGWPSALRHDGRPTYYQRRYDRSDADSPSRFPGVNPNRGPPDS